MGSLSKTQKALDKLNFSKEQKEGIVEVIDIKVDDAVSRLESKMDSGFKMLEKEMECQYKSLNNRLGFIQWFILAFGALAVISKIMGK